MMISGISLLLFALVLVIFPPSMAAQSRGLRNVGLDEALLGNRDWGLIQLGIYANIHSLGPPGIEPGIRGGIGIYKHHLVMIGETGLRECSESEDCTGTDPTYKLRLEIAPFHKVPLPFGPYDGTSYIYLAHSWIGETKGPAAGFGYMMFLRDSPFRGHAEVDVMLVNENTFDGSDSNSLVSTLFSLALGITVLL